ncbi:hypothetical protein Hte_012426 [Hypoxylon texense]
MASTTDVYPEPDDDKGPAMVTVYVVQCSLALLFLILRLWARLSIHTLGLDDLFMGITWITYAVATGFAWVVSANGGYRHSYYLDPEQSLYVTRLSWISQPWDIFAQGFGKIAICFLLLRIFGAISRWRKCLIWVVLVLNSINCLLTIVFTYVKCENPEALWDPAVRARTRCWSAGAQNSTMLTLQSVNCSFDFILAIIPTTFIWRLRFPLLKRIGLVLSLGGGFFSGVFSALKVKSLVTLSDDDDIPRSFFDLFIWASCEICVIVLCGCIPTLMPLWDRFEKNLRFFISKSAPPSTEAPQERRRKPTCMRGFTTEIRGSVGQSDTLVSSLGAKAFEDESIDSRSASIPNAKSVPSGQDEGASIQVIKSYQVDYSNPSEV